MTQQFRQSMSEVRDEVPKFESSRISRQSRRGSDTVGNERIERGSATRGSLPTNYKRNEQILDASYSRRGSDGVGSSGSSSDKLTIKPDGIKVTENSKDEFKITITISRETNKENDKDDST